MNQPYEKSCYPCRVYPPARVSISRVAGKRPDRKGMCNTLRLSAHDRQLLQEVKKFVEMREVDERFSLKQLCRRYGLNEFKLKNGFRELFHHTIYDYFLVRKMSEAKRLLLQEEASVNGVAYTLGYQHVSNFCIQFKKRVGMTPREWKLRYMPEEQPHMETPSGFCTFAALKESYEHRDPEIQGAQGSDYGGQFAICR